MLCKNCTLTTVAKHSTKLPKDEWKVKLLQSMHSPIRTLEFCFKLTDIPYYISTHLCRHVHATPFVQTQRNDRQTKYDRRKAPQDAPVEMNWYMNAEELINVAHKRLCMMADPGARALVQMIVDAVIKVNPEFESVLVPNCAYRGGICTEFNCCGLNKKYQKQMADEYLAANEDNMTIALEEFVKNKPEYIDDIIALINDLTGAA